MPTEHALEQARLAEKDSKQLEELASWLSSYHFAIDACGHSGEIERKKIQELAPKAIKALANYI